MALTFGRPLAANAADFVVNSQADQADANPGDGVCRTSANTCTLRAALQEANALPGADLISLPAGTYAIQIPTLSADLDTTGDWDIHAPVTIAGAGLGVTILDAGNPLPGADPTARGMDRLIEVHPTAGNVTIRDLTLREGYSVADGGAIQNWSPGLLRLERVHVRDSYAGGAGGGLNNANPAEYEWVVEPLAPPKSGRVEIMASTFSGNAAADSGAAINNAAAGSVTIMAGSSIINNPGLMVPDPAQVIDPFDPEPIEYVPGPGVYWPGAGAIGNQATIDLPGTIRIVHSTVSGNFATANGAGVLNDGAGLVVIENSTIADNHTPAGGGGLYTNGGDVTITGSTLSGNVAADGGGIYSNGAVDTLGLRPHFALSGSTISENTAHAGGGGMHNGGEAHLAITDVSFSNNVAHDAGGGLSSADRSSVSILRTTFSGNVTNGEGGGAWFASERLVTIADSVFDGNAAGVPEPGDVLDPSSANIAGGGGMYTEGGPVTITGSTFANNTATETGGGLSLSTVTQMC
ncbi:MAG TPA: CSLREA domain-containing protein, partial [Rhodospirillales bacterium]